MTALMGMMARESTLSGAVTLLSETSFPAGRYRLQGMGGHPSGG